MDLRNRFQKSVFIALVLGLVLFVLGGTIYAQDTNPEVVVMPSSLERISWGAILAGTVIAIVIQLAGNLLAIGIGVSSINPNPDYGDDVPSAESIGMNTLIMMALSVLLALFIGGYVAARFAGLPNEGDALLHGLMVWGLNTVITLFLLTTTLGNIFSGLSRMMGQGLRAIGSATSAVAQGASTVVQGAANIAGTVGGAVGDAAKNVGAAVGDAASGAADTAQNTAQDIIQSEPELRRLASQRNDLMQRMQDEAMKLINEAGLNTDSIRYEVKEAAEGAKDAVVSAVQDVQQNPAEIQQILSDAFARVFQEGEMAVGELERQVSQVDRDSMIDLLVTRANMDRQAAEEQLMRWENDYNKLWSEGQTLLNRARRKGKQVIQEAGVNAEKLQAEAMMKLEQAKEEAEHKAREVAEATTKFISRMALAAFAVLMIGAAAGGIGGIVGAQDSIESVEVEDGDDDANTGAIDSVEPTIMATNSP